MILAQFSLVLSRVLSPVLSINLCAHSHIPVFPSWFSSVLPNLPETHCTETIESYSTQLTRFGTSPTMDDPAPVLPTAVAADLGYGAGILPC